MDDKPLLMNAAQAQIALGVGRKAFKELEKNVKIVRLGRRKMYQWKDLTSGLEKMKEEPCTSKEPDFTTPPKSRRTRRITTRVSGSMGSQLESVLAQLNT